MSTKKTTGRKATTGGAKVANNKQGANVRNFDATVKDTKGNNRRRRSSSAPSTPVSSAKDKQDRAAALNIGAPVGSATPVRVGDSRGAYLAWMRKQSVNSPRDLSGVTFSAFLHDMSAGRGEVGEYANSIAAAVDDAITGRGGRVRIILQAVREYLVRKDGAVVGNMLADGFAAWITPAGFFMLTPDEINGGSPVRVSRRLVAYVAANIPAAFTADGKQAEGVVSLADGGGVVLGSSRVSGGVKVTSWGRSSRIMGNGAAVGKTVRLSFEAWLSWLKYCYNKEEALNHADIVREWSACDSVLRYAKSGRAASSTAKAAPVIDDATKQAAALGKQAAAVGLTSEKLAALSPEKLAALKALLA